MQTGTQMSTLSTFKYVVIHTWSFKNITLKSHFVIFLWSHSNSLSLEFKCHSSVHFFPKTAGKLRNSQFKQMKWGFNPQFSEMKTERKREALECTAKLKTNETNLFQSLGNVEANNSQRNVHARTHTTHRTSGSVIKHNMIKLFNSEGMSKRQGRGNLQNISGNMLCACKSVVFSPQLRSHVLFHI